MYSIWATSEIYSDDIPTDLSDYEDFDSEDGQYVCVDKDVLDTQFEDGDLENALESYYFRRRKHQKFIKKYNRFKQRIPRCCTS